MLAIFATKTGSIQEVMGVEADRKQRRKCISTDRRMERGFFVAF